MADLKAKKTTSKKTTVKPVSEKASVKEASVKVETPKVSKNTGVETSVFDITGKAAGKITLPSEIFAAKINPELMAQVIRVYMFTQRRGMASTKTRGEVNGTTKKVYRQKGTGRARHGAAKAPIFVGGGITFGPKPRDFGLSIPKKMRRASLFSALTSKLADKKVMVFDSVSVKGKTSEMNGLLKGMSVTPKKVTIVVDSGSATAARASKNLEGVTVIRAEDLHTYLVLNSNMLIFTKNSIDVLTNTFITKTIN